MKLQAKTLELTGTSYEIGRKLGRLTAAIPPLRTHHTTAAEGFAAENLEQAVRLFHRWCPGLTDELQGFADALGVPLRRVLFCGMTYLVPRCSHAALSPAITLHGRPLIARNYEFSHEAEDFCLVKTSPAGRHAHLGTSVLHFGRDDGLNEHGLSVTMSSCGFPVGPIPNMRAPALAGLQFWAVVRTLLENCRTVQEAVDYTKELPIAFNINLLLADKAGHIALVETLDGRMAVRRLEDTPAQFLHAANHPVLDELIPYEPRALRHSLIRYDWLREQLEGARGVTADRLKDLLLAKFPQGLACHYFHDYFGTTKSMVIDPAGGTIELCWGGEAQNGWKTYRVADPMEDSVREIVIHSERFDPKMGQYVPLTTGGGQ